MSAAEPVIMFGRSPWTLKVYGISSSSRACLISCQEATPGKTPARRRVFRLPNRLQVSPRHRVNPEVAGIHLDAEPAIPEGLDHPAVPGGLRVVLVGDLDALTLAELGHAPSPSGWFVPRPGIEPGSPP